MAGTATIDVFGFFTGQFIFTVDSTTVSATVGTGGGVNSLAGAQLTTLVVGVGWFGCDDRAGRVVRIW